MTHSKIQIQRDLGLGLDKSTSGAHTPGNGGRAAQGVPGFGKFSILQSLTVVKEHVGSVHCVHLVGQQILSGLGLKLCSVRAAGVTGM